MTRPVKTRTNSTTRLDLSVLSGMSFNKTVPVRMGLDASSTKAAGIAKAANLFYKILFTLKGSNPLDPIEGTTLLRIYESGISEVDTMYVDVRNAVGDALDQVQSIQNRNNAPADEKITRVDITQFEVDRQASSLDFAVNIYVASGESTAFEIPSIVLT